MRSSGPPGLLVPRRAVTSAPSLSALNRSRATAEARRSGADHHALAQLLLVEQRLERDRSYRGNCGLMRPVEVMLLKGRDGPLGVRTEPRHPPEQRCRILWFVPFRGDRGEHDAARSGRNPQFALCVEAVLEPPRISGAVEPERLSSRGSGCVVVTVE